MTVWPARFVNLTKTPGDDRVAVRASREIHVDAAGRAVVGSKRQAQQAHFAAALHDRGEVEVILGLDNAVPQHADAAGLLDHHLDRWIRRILHERNGRVEPVGDEMSL